MSSEKTKSIAFSPFVRVFTFAVLKSIKTRKLVEEKGETIDAELIPRVSRRVMEASLKRDPSTFIKLDQPLFVEKKIQKTLPKRIPIRRKPLVNQSLAAPLKPKRRPAPRPVPAIQPTSTVAPIYGQPEVAPPIVTLESATQGPTNNYGKIQPILLDPSVSTIDCPGPGKQLTVIRAGQREFTKIILTPQEINEIIETAAESAHIPVMEGVFRAAVDNFSINAVISEMIGSRFTIKKQTPYSMLENS